MVSNPIFNALSLYAKKVTFWQEKGAVGKNVSVGKANIFKNRKKGEKKSFFATFSQFGPVET